MPTPGQSLVGFLDQAQGIAHLKSACVVSDPAEAALAAEWVAARQRLGAPTQRAGRPEILPIPKEGMAHIQNLLQQQWVAQQLQAALKDCEFVLAEIKPLLAFQLSVDSSRSDQHNGHVAKNPSLSDMLPICLPLDAANEPIQVHQAAGSLMVTSRSLNFQAFARGFIHQNFIGLQVGVSLPLVHVVRFNDRCYLHNGFHRAVGLGKRGATHVPCVFRDVTSPEAVGIKPEGTFLLDLLESEDPPTVAHFVDDRAYDVRLKAFKRTLHISWAEYITTEE